MSDAPIAANGHSRRGIRFDPTINLGHIGTMGVSLLMIGMAWANLDTRVTQATKTLDEQKAAIAAKADKETVGKGEIELARRITEQQSLFNQTGGRTAEDIREIKIMIRDLGRDIGERLDRKADKPAR